MVILFLVYHGFAPDSGISQKIHYQVKGLRQSGHQVYLCSYDFDERGHHCRIVDGNVLQDCGTGLLAAIRQRTSYGPLYDYCVQHGVQLVYARCFQNANPWLTSFFRRLRRAGIHAVTEVPTYPYDAEFRGFPLKERFDLAIDRLFRRRLYREQDAVVTFTNEREIFGQRTIRISNGVDFDTLPLHRYAPPADGALHIIGVAELHYWHGYDRLIAGLGDYYASGGQRQVVFHIVGGVGRHGEELRLLAARLGVEARVVFHGKLFGDALTAVFDVCRLAVGSLGRHRSGISDIKTLKNREYATRGLPFIYSEHDSDFDHQPYVLKIPADESAVDVKALVRFADSCTLAPSAIRESVSHLSWKMQMGRVVEAVMSSSEPEYQQ